MLVKFVRVINQSKNIDKQSKKRYSHSQRKEEVLMVDKKIKNRFAEFLAKKEREDGRSYTHQDISIIAKVAKSTIGSYMRNETLRYDVGVVSRLCQFLGIKPEDFFTWVEISEGSEEDTEESTLLAIAV